MNDAERLAAFVHGLSDFELVEEIGVPYEHMGATITDAVLQAGLNYQTVVWPRVQHVMRAFPQATTTSSFLDVLRERGGEEVIRWTHPEKLSRIQAVAELFIAEGVETESDLQAWLCGDAPDCRANVASLRSLHGMGPKTIDYFKILCGEEDTAAIDVHLLQFLGQAGIHTHGYKQAREVVVGAAKLLGISAARFDHSIWTYVSEAKKTW